MVDLIGVLSQYLVAVKKGPFQVLSQYLQVPSQYLTKYSHSTCQVLSLIRLHRSFP